MCQSHPYYSTNCAGAVISLSSFPQPTPGTPTLTAPLSADRAESSPTSNPTTSARVAVSAGISTAFTAAAITASISSEIESSTGSAAQPTLTPALPISSTTSIIKTEGSTTTLAGSDTLKGWPIIVTGAIAGLGLCLLLLFLVAGLIWFCKFRRKRAIPVQEHSPQNVEQHSQRGGDGLNAANYSLLGTPTRPLPLELTLEDVE